MPAISIIWTLPYGSISIAYYLFGIQLYFLVLLFLSITFLSVL